MPVYKCPRCGRTVELPDGKYYCKVCGSSTIMVRLPDSYGTGKTPLEKALSVLPKYYKCEEPKQKLEWYFGKDWNVLNETSKLLLELTSDADDAVAWELHEIVEACEYYRLFPSPSSPDWRSETFRKQKPLAHKKATEVELKYLRDIGREDLIEKLKERELSRKT